MVFHDYWEQLLTNDLFPKGISLLSFYQFMFHGSTCVAEIVFNI